MSLDYAKRSGVIIRKSANAEVLEEIRRQLAEGEDLADVDYSRLVRVDELDMGREPEADPLTAQLRHFLRSARGEAEPMVDGEAGFAAVEAAEQVVRAIREHQWEGLAVPSV